MSVDYNFINRTKDYSDIEISLFFIILFYIFTVSFCWFYLLILKEINEIFSLNYFQSTCKYKNGLFVEVNTSYQH